MRKIILLLVIIFQCTHAFSQTPNPVKWSFTTDPEKARLGEEIDLVFTATIQGDWYLYSSDVNLDPGPMPTTFTFRINDTYDLIGKVRPIGASTKFDNVFNGDVTYFNNKAEFRKKVRVLSKELRISGLIEYQVCSDKEGKCIPFESAFRFDNIEFTEDPVDHQTIQTPADSTDTTGVQSIVTQPLMLFDSTMTSLSDTSKVKEDSLLQPAKWNYTMTISEPSVGDEIELIFKADIHPDWFLYSSDFTLDPGPIPASFTFSDNETVKLIGDIRPIGALTKFDEIFEGDVTYFKKKAEFRQKVKILSLPFYVHGTLEYQVCSDIDGKCIPFESDFSFGNVSEIHAHGLEGKIYEQGMKPEEDTLWGFMIFAFISGILALLTPCVFPMIPMTVSFFLKESEGQQGAAWTKGTIFGISIILIFTVLGTFVALMFGADALNQLATHWIPNIFIFIVFLIFALSFLGLFEITLPSSLVTTMDRRAEKGGIAGVFFMAFTLALVSFSCTFPIVGSVLVLSAQGEFLKPIMGMLAFSFAFALPFTIFAFFPNLLKKMPKSGGWLNSVKVILGFLELALGLKFLSVADQAYHWGILDREIYLAFWIVIFSLMGIYLLGKIRMPHDSPSEKVSVPALLMAVIVFTFVVYLIPGMFGAPLKALAGYLPPTSTLDFDLYKNTTAQFSAKENKDLCVEPLYADFLHLPHGLSGYFDYEQALDCAREQKKPVFIDFTGHGCVNCREMESRVWSDPEVLERLRNDFVVLALYVDDKKTLPESEWYTSEYDGKVKKTIGKQNADFQIKRFKNNAQPFYIIIDHDENVIAGPKAYDLNVSNFVSFLEEGKRAFQQIRME